MKGTVHRLTNGRFGVFINKGRLLVSQSDTYPEAEKEAERVLDRSYFIVKPVEDGWSLEEVRFDDWMRKQITTHHCVSPGELHRLKLRLVGQGLYEEISD